ncbi:thiopeptide-type bacteriocin biosynthesis protein [Primorskyibacter sp. 2E107]|uniref:thiopeptide-type bacteriocin biosynthesis protein n=1 Tax=Primorskyibacter sp. 2E107 TaxID=3403458 RepID=UPI003AF6FEC2
MAMSEDAERLRRLQARWAAMLRAKGLDAEAATGDAGALECFIKGGALALKQRQERGNWVQMEVGYAQVTDLPALFGAIRDLAIDLLADDQITNHFFMRKPPGLRLRFEASRAPNALRARLHDQAGAWRGAGLITDYGFGLYEPECQLFGGPQSMTHVHALFTLDTLAWLNWFGTEGGRGQTETWRASFALLRAVLDGLEIVGWEDLGVWSQVVDGAGRRLPPQSFTTREEQAALTAPVLRWWSEAGDADTLVRNEASAMMAAAARWRHGYFRRPECRIGARQAAALFTIYHWNRAGLSPVEQGLIAETLAHRRSDRRGSAA